MREEERGDGRGITVI